MAVRGVLLDVDGTLIDSNDAHARAWIDVGREFGIGIAFDKVRWLIGMGGDKVLPRLTGLEEASDDGARMLERRGEIFRTKYLSQLRAFPDARALLERMRADGCSLVVATSASEEDLAALLQQGGLTDLIEDAANADDAEESKPAPDIIEAALQRVDAAAGNVVMLGDTPYDVKAALAAGVRVIALRCGGWTDEQLEGASEIWDDAADLLRNYDTSLLSRSR